MINARQELSPALRAQRVALVAAARAALAAEKENAPSGAAATIRHRLSDHREWTEAEDSFLRENVGRLSFEELGAKLNRSAIACTVRVKRELRLDRAVRKANRDTLNASDVARILGQDIHFVERQLIAWGLLRAKKHEWLGTNGTMQWAIRREDLLDFLLDYPWQYDRERITDPFFRRAADEAWNRDPLYTTPQVARILGFTGNAGETGHAVSSFLKNTASKFVPRSKLLVRRRGNPRNVGNSSSESGMQTFIPRSTLLAIKASGWFNYKTLLQDPNWWTVERAAKELQEDPECPPYVRPAMLRERLRRMYQGGAIPTRKVQLGARKPWMLAGPDDVRRLLPALFARDTVVLRLTPARRRLLERHDPGLLADPRALALALATGDLAHQFRLWYDEERQAQRELAILKAKRHAFVTRHLARTLETLGPRTKYRRNRRVATYHLLRHVEQLVAIPLREAKAHALYLCGYCEFTKQRRRRPEPTPFLLVCVDCTQRFPRGRGRPARVPRCTSCRGHDRRAA